MYPMKQKRVLLVDEDESYLNFLREKFLERNYEIAGEANNCEQAIELYHSEKPDLTLLDFNMLSIEGTQTLQEIFIQDSETVILMLNGKGDILTMQLCLDIGAYHYIRKDHPLETIFSVIEESLNKFVGMES